MRKLFPVAVLATCGVLVTGMHPAHSDLVTSPTSIPVNSPTVDFSQFAATGYIKFPRNAPPFAIDDLPNETVLMRATTSISAAGSVLILGDPAPPLHPDTNFYLDQNGRWTPGRAGFLAVDNGPSSSAVLRIEFPDGPVALVGGVFNHSVLYPSLIISALDSNLVTLEQYAITAVAPISTPGQLDIGEFRGIKREQNDIFALRIEANFVVIDDIRFFRIPEPPTASLLAIGLVLARRRYAN